ncbi:MAG: glycoside hydrolase family 16 protein [Chitinophagaceae bacterium]|nr:MAG: glycoside hydrolase family 16 protein [Chitinophagaceae bacterium]
MRNKLLFFYVLIVLCVAACSKTKHIQKSTLSWEENFNTLDESRWSKIPRGKSDWDRHMSSFDSLFAIRDGKLILRGINNTTQTQDTAKVITGGVYTKDKVGFGFGRLEIRAKLGHATGAWPAFWLLGQGRKYPEGGEIDIMEHLNHDNMVYQTVHSYYTITLNEKKNPPQGGTAKIIPNEFNTYAVEKYRDSVVFYVNDKRTFAYPRINTTKKDQFPFAEGDHFLLLDMQLGGNWVGKIDPAQLPVEMEIDWVRFYQFKQKK